MFQGTARSVRTASQCLCVVHVPGHCKECKNFNSMFAIVSGLGHGSVSRLRSTWDKVPTKYAKMFVVSLRTYAYIRSYVVII